MNFNEWNEEWNSEIKNLLLQILRDKNNDPWNLHYENQTRVDFDEFLARLYDDRYFEDLFIIAYEKKFPDKIKIIEQLKKINKLLNELGDEITVSVDLLKNEKWIKIRESVKILFDNGF